MLLILLAAALGATSPNADANDVACVLGQTSAEDVIAIGDSMLAGRDSYGGAVEDRLTEHLTDCVRRFGWDDARTVRASTLAIAQMGGSIALRRLAAAGIDAGALDRWFDAQSEDFRTRAFVGMSEDEAAAVFETLAPNTLSAELLEGHAELIGGYIATRVMTLRAERGLSLE